MEKFEFAFRVPTQIIFGCGCIEKLGKEVSIRGANKILLVCDSELSSLGVAKRLVNILGQEKKKVVLFDRTQSEPELEVADECAALGKSEACDFVVGVGGGSSLDIAKAAAILMTNEGSARDYQGSGKVKNSGLKTIMIPSTAGTGSEVTPTAVFINKQAKIKLGINSPYLFPDLALLDPELTLTLSSGITAATGADALTHAIEAYTANQSSLISDMFALRAIELITQNLEFAVKNGSDLKVRGNMLLASCLAGIAIANAGVGASHAISYPLSVFYQVPHGVANGLLIPHVMKFNCETVTHKYANIAAKMGLPIKNLTLVETGYKVCEKVSELIKEVGIPQRLSSFGVSSSSIAELAHATMQLTPVVRNNPRTFTEEDAKLILNNAL